MDLTYFIPYHCSLLAIFIVAVVKTWKTISQLRNDALAYKGRLPFAYYSLSAWIFWALQYLVLIAWTLRSRPDHTFLSAAISIGLVGNALWAVAVLSLYSKRVNRWSLTPTYVMAFLILMGLSILTALVVEDLSYHNGRYEIEILGSPQFTLLEGFFCIAIFAAFALSINELRLNKWFAVAFLIHGVSQGPWQLLFSSPSTIRLALLLVFLPVWHIAIFLFWTKLIPQLLQTAQSRSDSRLRVALLRPFIIMVSSTVEDLIPERKAADRAIRELHLDGFLAEKYGSVSDTPRNICEHMARHCNIFILIIGQRYGHVPEPDGISVMQFEFETARAASRQKILVYVKEGVSREERLKQFLKGVDNFNSGYFRASFTSHKGLRKKIRVGIMKWFVSRETQRQEAG